MDRAHFDVVIGFDLRGPQYPGQDPVVDDDDRQGALSGTGAGVGGKAARRAKGEAVHRAVAASIQPDTLLGDEPGGGNGDLHGIRDVVGRNRRTGRGCGSPIRLAERQGHRSGQCTNRCLVPRLGRDSRAGLQPRVAFDSDGHVDRGDVAGEADADRGSLAERQAHGRGTDLAFQEERVLHRFRDQADVVGAPGLDLGGIHPRRRARLDVVPGQPHAEAVPARADPQGAGDGLDLGGVNGLERDRAARLDRRILHADLRAVAGDDIDGQREGAGHLALEILRFIAFLELAQPGADRVGADRGGCPRLLRQPALVQGDLVLRAVAADPSAHRAVDLVVRKRGTQAHLAAVGAAAADRQHERLADRLQAQIAIRRQHGPFQEGFDPVDHARDRNRTGERLGVGRGVDREGGGKREQGAFLAGRDVDFIEIRRVRAGAGQDRVLDERPHRVADQVQADTAGNGTAALRVVLPGSVEVGTGIQARVRGQLPLGEVAEGRAPGDDDDVGRTQGFHLQGAKAPDRHLAHRRNRLVLDVVGGKAPGYARPAGGLRRLGVVAVGIVIAGRQVFAFALLLEAGPSHEGPGHCGGHHQAIIVGPDGDIAELQLAAVLVRQRIAAQSRRRVAADHADAGGKAHGVGAPFAEAQGTSHRDVRQVVAGMNQRAARFQRSAASSTGRHAGMRGAVMHHDQAAAQKRPARRRLRIRAVVAGGEQRGLGDGHPQHLLARIDIQCATDLDLRPRIDPRHGPVQGDVHQQGAAQGLAAAAHQRDQVIATDDLFQALAFIDTLAERALIQSPLADTGQRQLRHFDGRIDLQTTAARIGGRSLVDAGTRGHQGLARVLEQTDGQRERDPDRGFLLLVLGLRAGRRPAVHDLAGDPECAV